MLRIRLLLGFLPVLLILLATGLYALWLVSRLAGEAEDVLLKNYRSASAIQNLRESAMRMDRGVVFVLDGQSSTGRMLFDSNVRSVHQHLLTKLQHLTPREKELTEELIERFRDYEKAGRHILELPVRADQRRAYTREFAPRLSMLIATAEQIYDLQEKAVAEAERDIQQVRIDAGHFMVLALLMALTLSLYTAVQSSRSILRPLQLLTRSADEIARGNLEQTVPVMSRDELGQLASAFNRMALQVRAFRESTSARIMRLHRSMETTLSSFPDPIYVLTANGQIELQNPAALELGQNLKLSGQLPPLLRERVQEALRFSQDSLPTSFKEALCFRWSERDRFFLPRVLIMRQENQEPFGAAVVLLDITRFRLLDDVKTNLIGTVSHELKTPLTSILMALHILREGTLGSLDRKQLDLITSACSDAERLLRILNDLLDLARLEHDSVDLRLEELSGRQLAAQVIQHNQELLLSRDLKLATELAPNLPSVKVDLQRISHVFTNLFNNAIKHSPAGSTITFTVSAHSEKQIRFALRDAGEGIAEEYQDRIFEKFFRIPGQPKSTGAGLGLSIAREIVTAHGGKIGVRSRQGEGSEFYVLLPVEMATAPRLMPAATTT